MSPILLVDFRSQAVALVGPVQGSRTTLNGVLASWTSRWASWAWATWACSQVATATPAWAALRII